MEPPWMEKVSLILFGFLFTVCLLLLNNVIFGTLAVVFFYQIVIITVPIFRLA